MTIGLSALLTHYKNIEVQKLIVENAEHREVAVKFGDKGFGKRPDTLSFPTDVIELAKQGATSFHASEELWGNPLQIDTGMKKEDVEGLRIGWDLVIDIDCKILEYSAIAADLIIKAMKHQGVNSFSIKFSGNHGFHIGVPFEAFPKKVHGKETRLLFPEAPRKIARYLEHMIRPYLAKGILKIDDVDSIAEKTGKEFKEIVIDGEFDPFTILEIDTLLISSRHLYRMPYCFNEKSGLISVPINPSKILEFNKEDAKPENVRISRFKFLDRKAARENEAEKLIVQAFDFEAEDTNAENDIYISDSKERRKNEDFEALQEAIPEELFPPCIKKGLNGIEDGRKRFVFVLVNFLTSAGWDYDKIEETLTKWNKRNREELREVLLKGQLRYHKQNRKKKLPPNCSNKMYYKDISLCIPDNLCGKIKNPLNYAKRKAFAIMKQDDDSRPSRKKLTEEQKEMRRKFREEKKKKR